MHTVVFGDDGSPGADVAWLWINGHRWPGWRVDIVQVSEPEVPHVGDDQADLQPWAPPDPRPLMPDIGLARRHLSGIGDPRGVLGSLHPELIVIGPTGTGFLKRWLHLGSTAEALVHDPPAPVLIAKSAARTHRALVAVDGSTSAHHAAEALAALPLTTEVDVHVLGVYDGWSEPEAGVEKAVDTLAAAARSITSDVVRGEAPRTIVETARDRASDLVVVGARGMSSVHRALAGSTTAGLARALDVNVLVAP